MVKNPAHRKQQKTSNLRALAKLLGVSHTTLFRKLKRWRMEKPWDVAAVRAKLAAAPVDAMMRRGAGREETAPMSPAVGMTLERLELQIRETLDRDEADRLSRQVRALRVLQEVMAKDARSMDAREARAEVGKAVALFEATIKERLPGLAKAVVGKGAVELEGALEGEFRALLAVLQGRVEEAVVAGVSDGEAGTPPLPPPICPVVPSPAGHPLLRASASPTSHREAIFLPPSTTNGRGSRLEG